MSQFSDLYSKVLSDSDFRTYLAQNPSAALTSIGITPTDELVAAVTEVINGVASTGAALGADDRELIQFVS